MPKLVINHLVHTNQDIKKEIKYNDSKLHTTKYQSKIYTTFKPLMVTKQGQKD